MLAPALSGAILPNSFREPSPLLSSNALVVRGECFYMGSGSCKGRGRIAKCDMTEAGTMTTIEARGRPGHAHQRQSTIVRQSLGDIQATFMRRQDVLGGRHGSGYGD
jgi:hypothetical protein